MAKRIVTKIGNVFLVKLEDKQKYFQYVANDMTMLNSSVIRVFKQHYPLGCSPELSEVVKDEIDFYAHVVLRWGVELDLWEKIGKEEVIGTVDPLFRRSLDYGEKDGISERWQVWHINDPDFTFVGKLIGENRKAAIGIVMTGDDIVYRMQTGEYEDFYPHFL